MKIDSSDVTIVIPVHNRKQYTIKCLESLHQQSIQGFKIIIVDDGSTDGTSDAVQQKFPDVTILKGDGNLWWSEAMNKGVNDALKSGTKYILSLNDDLEVAPNYLEKMFFYAEHKPFALMGSYVFDINTKRPFSGGARIDWRRCKTISPLSEVPEQKRRGLYRIDDATGRGLWIPAAVFIQIGLFDSKTLPQYGSDNDFSLRARKYGFELFCNFDAILYSHVEASGQLYYKQMYSLRNFFNHIFGRKGTGNIKNFTILCFRYCPKQYILTYFLFGIVKRMAGYFINWAKHTDWRGHARPISH